jgi:hypothetical protein
MRVLFWLLAIVALGVVSMSLLASNSAVRNHQLHSLMPACSSKFVRVIAAEAEPKYAAAAQKILADIKGNKCLSTGEVAGPLKALLLDFLADRSDGVERMHAWAARAGYSCERRKDGDVHPLTCDCESPGFFVYLAPGDGCTELLRVSHPRTRLESIWVIDRDQLSSGRKGPSRFEINMMYSSGMGFL